ncbi:MAG TPA: RNA methyltransferase [Roseiflexaceae bacterium]|nr:RNA methyltransferase [Roseiflexaceae bacterium]
MKRAGTPFANVSPEQFRAVSQAERASGVGAILRQRLARLPDLAPGDRPCWVALGQVRSQGNFGTLVRSAAACGAAGFILLDPSLDPFDPAVVRPTMGTLFQQTLARATIDELRIWVRRHRLQVIGASPDGALAYASVSFHHPTVLMLGEERRGLTSEQQSLCQQMVRIPMAVGVDSLNMAVAGSLLLFEIVRSLRQPSIRV